MILIKKGGISVGNTFLVVYQDRQGVIPSPDRRAVINEALRIHPSTGLTLERCVPKGGIVLHRIRIPEKTIIGVNCWAVNRNKEIFGKDVEIFRPERWIDSPPLMIQKMRTNLFTVSFQLVIKITSHQHYQFGLHVTYSADNYCTQLSVWRRLKKLYWEEHCHGPDNQGGCGTLSGI